MIYLRKVRLMLLLDGSKVDAACGQLRANYSKGKE